jgi:Na+/H+ antiporter NhaD/arsenite permease-like protein
MIIPIIVLLIVFLLIALRQIGNARLQLLQITLLRIPVGKAFKLEIWHIMLFGAAAVLFTGQISPVNAAASINLDVILFLFGMFVIGQSLEQSGYLSHLSCRLFRRAKTADSLLLFILFGMGIAAAFLMNDTVAIIGTPVVLMLAKNRDLPPKMLLLALAFAVTIGSVMSPIGNPQNLLIALSGQIPNPFSTFFSLLLIPTLINLFLAYLLLKFFYKDKLKRAQTKDEQHPIKDRHLAFLSKFSLVLIVLLIFLKVLLVFTGLFDIRLTYVALVSMLPILIFSRKRIDIIRSIDWKTLIFFASMFVLMASVWETGVFQSFIQQANLDITSIIVILLVSILLSQLISNVPLVALYLPLLMHTGVSTKALVALAAGSTIAGNLFILGAASNVIIIQNAEKKANETLTFAEFAKIGIPLTVINIAVYWAFLSIV